MAKPEIKEFGANPVSIQWAIVRGDTSSIRIEFLENDEKTFFDTSTWQFASSAYGAKDDIIDPLEVIPGDGYVDIVASSEITALWGATYSKVVAELLFDLQVIIDGDKVWTPVVGTIKVIGDVTGGSL
jgi:hypothetical protein